MLEEFIKKKISAARQYAAEKFQDVAISNPKLAAGYIKNAYAIEKLKDERGVFDAVVSEMTRGTYATADEWLSSATSIEEDVTMRRQIIDAANTVKKK